MSRFCAMRFLAAGAVGLLVLGLAVGAGCGPGTPCDEVHDKVVSCGLPDDNDVFNLVYPGECSGVKLCAARCSLTSGCAGFTNGVVTHCEGTCGPIGN